MSCLMRALNSVAQLLVNAHAKKQVTELHLFYNSAKNYNKCDLGLFVFQLQKLSWIEKNKKTFILVYYPYLFN